jgi:branched-chain amino acid transport system ATP-binding protein
VTAATGGAVLLDVRSLTVTYGGVTALADVDLTVGDGEVVGLIGPNGAGKTTCIDAIGGFVTPSRGEVALAGRPLEGLAPHARVGAGLARTFQACELFPDLTVRENLAVAAQDRTRWSWLRDAVAPRRTATGARVGELLDRFELHAEADVRPDALPHGRQRIVDLARALATRPRVVLLDEPAAGLDPAETDALGEVVRTLPGDGVAVLLVDHDMGLVMRSCSRIHVLDLGRVIASGPPDAVRADPAVVAAYLGRP